MRSERYGFVPSSGNVSGNARTPSEPAGALFRPVGAWGPHKASERALVEVELSARLWARAIARVRSN